MIRPAKNNDIDVLHDLIITTFRETYAGHPEMDPNEMEHYLNTSCAKPIISQHLADDQNNTFLLAFDKESIDDTATSSTPIGYAKLRYNTPAPPCVTAGTRATTVELERIYVRRQSLRQGVGRQLLQAAMDVAKEQVLLDKRASEQFVLWLGVWEHNPRAMQFYQQAFGFRKMGVVDFSVGQQVHGDWILQTEIGLEN